MDIPAAASTSSPIHRAELAFGLESEAVAAAVQGALAPETGDGPEGSATRIVREGATLHVEVEAQDISGLRAALNSTVRLLDAAVRVANG